MISEVSTSRPSRWPWIVLGVAFAFAAMGLVFVSLNGESLAGDATNFTAFMGMGVVGALSLSRAPDNRIGWLLLWVAVIVGAAFTTGEASIYVTEHGDRSLAAWLAWPGTALWAIGLFPMLILLPLWFPDGRVPSQRWRPLQWAGFGVAALAFIILGFGVADVRYRDRGTAKLANPLHVPALDRRPGSRWACGPSSSGSSSSPSYRWSSGSDGRVASSVSSSSGSRSPSSCWSPTS